MLTNGVALGWSDNPGRGRCLSDVDWRGVATLRVAG